MSREWNLALVKRLWPVLLPALTLLILTCAFSLMSASLQRTATSMLINLVAVVGLYVFLGNSGAFSLGHVGFMAFGGYVAAILSLPVATKAVVLPNLPSFLAHFSFPSQLSILAGGLAAAVLALVLSVPFMRMKAVAIPIATLAMLIIIRQIIIGWESVTGGLLTITGIPMKATLWIAFCWAVFALVIAFLFQNWRVGARLRACREDEVAARSLGISVLMERTAGWVTSAFVMGIAGGLYGQQLGMLYPNLFWVSLTFVIVVMLISGGSRSLAGAFVGTLSIAVLSELLRRLEQGFSVGSIHIPTRPGLRELAFALVMLLVLIRRPAGIMRGREFEFPFPWRTSKVPAGVEGGGADEARRRGTVGTEQSDVPEEE